MVAMVILGSASRGSRSSQNTETKGKKRLLGKKSQRQGLLPDPPIRADERPRGNIIQQP